MNKRINLIVKAVCSLFIIAALLLASSCKIGLGEAVDTERPTLEITYPPKAAVIRGSFILAGTCGDDHGITEVSVNLQNTSTREYVGPFKAQLSLNPNNPKDGKWQIVLNPEDPKGTNGWALPDGKYSIEVEASDGSKTSGVFAQMVEIDNTPPFFIANKPGSEDSNNPSRYGTSFNVTGTVAEDHDVSSMQLEIYKMKEDGYFEDTPVAVENGFYEKNIQTAGGINVKFANFSDIPDTTGNKRYLALYDETKTETSPTQTFKTRMVLVDSAKEYKNPDESKNETEGNSTDIFYLNDNIINLTSSSGYGLSAGELKEIVKRTSDQNKTVQENVRDVLNQKKSTETYFSLNPKSNPKYSIGSAKFQISTGFDSENKIDTAELNGQTGDVVVTASYNAGLNNSNIEPKSLAMYQVGPFYPSEITKDFLKEVYTAGSFLKLKSKPDGKAPYVYEIELNSNNQYLTDVSKIVELENQKNEAGTEYYRDSSSESLNYSYKLPKSITAGRVYILVAVGEDQEGVALECEEGQYCIFKGTSTGAAPNLEIGTENASACENLSNNSYIQNKKIIFSGTTNSTESKNMDGLTVSVTLNDGNGRKVTIPGKDNPFVKTIRENVVSPNKFVKNGEKYDWKIEIDDFVSYLTSATEGLYSYDININSFDEDNNPSAIKNFTINVDTSKPVSEITSISQLLTFNSVKDVVNGNITLSGTTTDSDKVAWTQLTVKDASGTVLDGMKTDGTRISNPAKNIITGKEDNKGDKYSFVINTRNLTDKKAYTLVLNSEDRVGIAGSEVTKVINVNQDSDNPVITFNNADDTNFKTTAAVTSEENTGSKNIFDQSSNNTLMGIITDDDGVASVTAYYSKDYNPSGAADNGNWEKFFEKTGLNITSYSLKAPLVKSTSANAAALDEGLYYVKVVVKDTDQTTIKGNIFAVGISAGNPAVNVTTRGLNYISSKSGSVKNVTVKGNYSGGSTTVIKRTYKVGNAAESTPATIPLAANKEWTDTIPAVAADSVNAKVVVTYTATNALNQKSTATYTYVIDNKKPVIGTFTDGGNSSNLLIDSKLHTTYGWKQQNSFTVGLKYSDDGYESSSEDGYHAGSGIKKIDYWITDYKADGSYTLPTKATGSYSDLDNAANSNVFSLKADTVIECTDGEKCLHVRAEDEAGNLSDISRFRIGTDSKAPVITLDQTDILTNEDSVTVTGTIEDIHSGLNTWAALRVFKNYKNYDDWTDESTWTASTPNADKVNHPDNEIAFFAALNGTTDASDGSVGAVAYNYDYKNTAKFKVTIPKSKLGADGKYTLTFVALDQPENRGEASVTIQWDQTKPDSLNNSTYPLKVNSKTLEVGEDVWFNSTALPVSGYFTEDYAASGISKIEFKVLPNGSATEISAGTCAATKDEASASGNRWKYESVINGFESGSGNKLYVIATDMAGNVSNKGSGYTIKIDKNGPTIQSDSTEAVKTNGKQQNLTITGTMGDDASGVKEIECYIKNTSTSNSQTITSTENTYGKVELVELDDKNKKWTLKIKCGTGSAVNSWFSTLQPNAVYATITDNAGNKTENIKIATLDVDTDAPTLSDIACSPFVENAKINGVTKLTGTVNVQETMGTVEAFYRLESAADSDANYKKIGTVEGSACYNWSINFNTKDTTTFTNLSATADTKIVLKVVATDKAGNSVSKTKPVTVSPDSDRPVISLDDLKITGSSFDALKVNGTVEDDDGTISAANFYVGEKIGGASTITWYNNTANPEKVTKFSNGAWTYVLDGTVQGAHTLYFKVSDAAGNNFASNGATALLKPKVRGATWTPSSTSDSGTEVTFTLDTKDPEIEDPIVIHGNNVEETFENNVIIGSNRDASFKIKVYAKDSSGIKSVSAQITDESPVSVTTGTAGTGTYSGYTLYQLTMAAPTTADLAGSKDVTLTVTDNADRLNVKTKSFLFDNAAPTLTVSYPNEQVDSSVEMRGTTTEVGEGVVSIGYLVPGSDVVNSWASKTTSQKDALFTTITDTLGNNATASWTLDWSPYDSSTNKDGLGLLTQFFYTTGDSNNLVYHNKKSASDTVTYGTETGLNTGVFDIPVYFRIEDKAGNVTYKTDYTVRYNPDGDRPVAKILYPEDDSKIGGTIRISGSATDNVAVKEVYIQIQKAGYTNGQLNSTFTDVTGYSSKKVDGTSSWSISIDGTSTVFGAPGSASYESNVDINARSKLRIRAKAVDNNGLEGALTDWVTFIIDKDAPVISNLTLVQYSNNNNPDASGNKIVKSKAYSSGTWISGKWWLNFDVEDTAGISSLYTDSQWTKEGSISRSPVTVSGVSDAENITATEISKQTVISGSSKGYKAAHVCIDTSGEGYVRFAINAKDNSEKKTPGSSDIYIRFDNNAPVQAEPKHNGDLIGDGKTSGTTTIVQENYTYQINSTAVESGSGLAYSIVYFKRPTSSSGYRVYDPRMDGSRSGSAGSYTYNDGAITSFTDTTEGLPSKKYTGVTRSAADTFTLSSADKYLKKNSAVKINGVYRLITGVNGATYSFTPADNDKSNIVEAVYGIVVDNTKTENLNTSTGAVSNDDGDTIYDNLTDEGSGNYSWKLSINSRNIPDGPLTVGIVSFDEAGNSSAKVEASTFVENNAPRIARVYLGTDLSGDGNFGGAGFENEILSYNTLVESTSTAGGYEGVAAATINALTGENAFTAKDKTLIRTEIVGGNGTMKYTWNYQTYGTSDWNATLNTGASTATAFDATTAVAASDEDALTIKTQKTASSRKDVIFNVTSNMLAGKISDGKAKINLTYWDETEEMTQGTNSLNATLSVEMNVDVVDEVAPKAVIDDFYWNDKDHNSLYDNSRENGHIDLPDAVAGDDPKVSGKVSFRGSAYDDQRLTALWMTIDTSDKENKFAFTGATSGTKSGRTYYKVASYANAVWTGTDKWETNGWKFTVTPDYQNQSGHRVTWQLDLDTSKITGVAAEDLLVRILAEDKRSTPNTSSETAATTDTADSKYNKPAYQIDVVPYITAMTRNIGFNTFRSSNGSYPMMRGETGNTVTGFNFEADSTLVLSSNTSGTTSAGTLTITNRKVNADGTVTLTFTAGNTIADGYVAVKSKTNSVLSINNQNEDTEYNTEAEAGKYQNAWNDDRLIRAFQSTDSDIFKGLPYPNYPALGMGNTGILYASATNSSKADVRYAKIGETTYTQIFTAGDQSEETDIMVAGANNVNVIYQANHHYGGTQDRWSARESGAGSINLYNSVAPNTTSYAKGSYWRFECFYHNQMLRQHKNARSATSGNGTSGIIHNVWYDSITNAIKYSNVTINNNTKEYNNNSDNASKHEICWVVIDGDSDLDDLVQVNQNSTNGYNGGENAYPNTDNQRNNSDGTNWAHYYSDGVTKTTGAEANYSVALGKTPEERYKIMTTGENATRGSSAVKYNTSAASYSNSTYSGYNYIETCFTNEGTEPANACGETPAICVTSAGLPVIVYYDTQHNMIKLARSSITDPKGIATASDAGASAWRIQQVPLTEGHLGNNADYISAKIDSNGYIHIIFENSKGELVYIKSSNAPTGGAKYEFANGSIVIDECGMWADITLDSNNRPYISYMNKANSYDSVKVAFCIDTTEWNNLSAWETMFAPMQKKASNVRTCIEARPKNTTAGGTDWRTAIGFSTGVDYRVIKYIGDGKQNY